MPKKKRISYIKEKDKTLLPDYLYSKTSKRTAGISPAATFNPAAAIYDNAGFQCDSTPASTPDKKSLIFDANSFSNLNEIGDVMGFLKRMQLLGFEIFLFCTEGGKKVIKKIDDDFKNAADLLDGKLAVFAEEDYKILAESQYQIERDKAIVLDRQKYFEVGECFSCEGNDNSPKWRYYFDAINTDYTKQPQNREISIDEIKENYRPNTKNLDLWIKFIIKNDFVPNDAFYDFQNLALQAIVQSPDISVRSLIKNAISLYDKLKNGEENKALDVIKCSFGLLIEGDKNLWRQYQVHLLKLLLLSKEFGWEFKMSKSVFGVEVARSDFLFNKKDFQSLITTQELHILSATQRDYIFSLLDPAFDVMSFEIAGYNSSKPEPEHVRAKAILLQLKLHKCQNLPEKIVFAFEYARCLSLLDKDSQNADLFDSKNIDLFKDDLLEEISSKISNNNGSWQHDDYGALISISYVLKQILQSDAVAENTVAIINNINQLIQQRPQIKDFGEWKSINFFFEGRKPRNLEELEYAIKYPKFHKDLEEIINDDGIYEASLPAYTKINLLSLISTSLHKNGFDDLLEKFAEKCEKCQDIWGNLYKEERQKIIEFIKLLPAESSVAENMIYKYIKSYSYKDIADFLEGVCKKHPSVVKNIIASYQGSCFIDGSYNTLHSLRCDYVTKGYTIENRIVRDSYGFDVNSTIIELRDRAKITSLRFDGGFDNFCKIHEDVFPEVVALQIAKIKSEEIEELCKKFPKLKCCIISGKVDNLEEIQKIFSDKGIKCKVDKTISAIFEIEKNKRDWEEFSENIKPFISWEEGQKKFIRNESEKKGGNRDPFSSEITIINDWFKKSLTALDEYADILTKASQEKLDMSQKIENLLSVSKLSKKASDDLNLVSERLKRIYDKSNTLYKFFPEIDKLNYYPLIKLKDITKSDIIAGLKNLVPEVKGIEGKALQPFIEAFSKCFAELKSILNDSKDINGVLKGLDKVLHEVYIYEIELQKSFTKNQTHISAEPPEAAANFSVDPLQGIKSLKNAPTEEGGATGEDGPDDSTVLGNSAVLGNSNVLDDSNVSQTDDQEIELEKPLQKPAEGVHYVGKSEPKTEGLNERGADKFEMERAGKALNVNSKVYQQYQKSDEKSDLLRLRANIIEVEFDDKGKLTSRKKQANKFDSLDKSKIKKIDDSLIAECSKSDGDYVFSSFSCSLKSDEKKMLYSLSANHEELYAIKAIDVNGKEIDQQHLQIEKDEDGFFYVTAKQNCKFEYILQNAPMKDLDDLKKNESRIYNKAKLFIDKLSRSEEKVIKQPEKEGKTDAEFLKELYRLGIGSCENRVFSFIHEVISNDDENEKKKLIRAVNISNNHVSLEFFENGKWHQISFSGEAAELSYDDNPKESVVVPNGDPADSAGVDQEPTSESEEYFKGLKKLFEKYDEIATSQDVSLTNQQNIKSKERLLQDLQQQLQEEQQKISDAKKEIKQQEAGIEKFIAEQTADLQKDLSEALDAKIKPQKIIYNEEELVSLISHEVNAGNCPNKTLIFTENSEEHANFLISKINLDKDNSTYFHVDCPDVLEFDSKDIVVLDQDNVNIKSDERKAKLENFLRGAQKNKFILFDCSKFTPAKLTGFNTLWDTSRTINGIKIADDIRIITFNQKTTDVSFLSRHNLTIESNVKFDKKIENEPELEEVLVDLEGYKDWKKYLFGAVPINADSKLGWKKGPIVDRLENCKKLKIINASAEVAEEIHKNFESAKAEGYFDYYGYKILLQKDLMVECVGKEFNFAKFNSDDSLKIHCNAKHNQIPQDAHVINTELFDILLQQKNIANGKYQEVSGLLSSSNGQELKLFITSELSLNQWYSLFNLAKKNDVKLKLYVAPQIDLPEGIKSENIAADANFAGFKLVSDVVVACNTRKAAADYVAQKNIADPIIINVEDCNYQSLIEQFDCKIIESEGTQKFADFEIKESPLIKEAGNGRKVIIRGEFSNNLLQMLQPIMLGLGKFQKIAKNITFVIENDSEKSRNVFKPLQWIDQDKDEKIEIIIDDNFVRNDPQQEKEDAPSDDPNISQDSADKSQKFITKRIKLLEDLLEANPMVALRGKTAVGKSQLLKKLHNQGGKYKVHSKGFDDFEKWVEQAAAKQDEVQVLFIDESNIVDSHYTTFEPLKEFANNPQKQFVEILYNNKLHKVSRNCKVVFASNPRSYGGGRSDNQKLFEDGTIPELHLFNPDVDYIYEEILKKTIYDFFILKKPALVKEEDFKKKCQELIKDYIDTNKANEDDINKQKTVRELQEEALDFLCEKLIESEGKKSIKIENDNFIETKATKEPIDNLRRAIEICQYQKKGILPQFTQDAEGAVGLEGIFLEGDSGSGKTVLIGATLEKMGVDVIEYPEKDKNSDSHVCYKIAANISDEALRNIMKKALEDGDMVWIDELNTRIDERFLNAILTGEHPDKKPLKPGFMLITSINSINFAGRAKIGPALVHRMRHPKVKDIKSYDKDSLKDIISHLIEHDKSIVDKSKKDQVAELVMKDFFEIIKTNPDYNFRILKDEMRQNYQKYEKFIVEEERRKEALAAKQSELRNVEETLVVLKGKVDKEKEEFAKKNPVLELYKTNQDLKEKMILSFEGVNNIESGISSDKTRVYLKFSDQSPSSIPNNNPKALEVFGLSKNLKLIASNKEYDEFKKEVNKIIFEAKKKVVLAVRDIVNAEGKIDALFIILKNYGLKHIDEVNNFNMDKGKLGFSAWKDKSDFQQEILKVFKEKKIFNDSIKTVDEKTLKDLQKLSSQFQKEAKNTDTIFGKAYKNKEKELGFRTWRGAFAYDINIQKEIETQSGRVR